MRGFRWAAGRSHVVIEPEVFAQANALWQVSPLAFKAYAWLFHKANHSDTPDFNGTAVMRGQYLVSFTRLATELGVRDARTVKAALLELVEIDAISIKGLLQKMSKAPAESAEGISTKRPAKNVEASRKPQLITVCRFNDLQIAPAKNVEVKSSYRTQRGKTRHADACASLPTHETQQANLMARARSRAEASGRSVDEELAQLRQRPNRREIAH